MVSAYIMQKNVLAISDMTVLDSLTATTVSNEAIRRLLRRGGATRCSAHGIQEIRAFLFTHLCQLIRDAFIYAKHEGTLCVTGFHIDLLSSFSSAAAGCMVSPLLPFTWCRMPMRICAIRES